MKRKAYVIAPLLALLGISPAWAQEALVPAGGTTTGSGGSVSYSVSYVAYPTVSGAGGSVSPGLLHPVEAYAVLSSRTRSAALNYSVYPNPTSESVTLTATGPVLRNGFYQLRDVHGRLVETQRLSSLETSISLAHLPPAVYLLTVREGKRDVRTFKIIKH